MKRIIHIKDVNMRITDILKVDESLKSIGYTKIIFLGDSLKDEYTLVIPLGEESKYLDFDKGYCEVMKKVIYKKGNSYSQEIVPLDNFDDSYKIDEKYKNYYKENKRKIKEYLAHRDYYQRNMQEGVIGLIMFNIMIVMSLILTFKSN